MNRYVDATKHIQAKPNLGSVQRVNMHLIFCLHSLVDRA